MFLFISDVTFMSSAAGVKCVGRFSYTLDITYVAGHYIYCVVALAGEGV